MITKSIDLLIFNYLMKKRNLPNRFGKFLALYFPDARVRKNYSNYINTQFGENTFANLGFKVIPNDHDLCVYIGDNVSIGPNVTMICNSSPNNSCELLDNYYVKEKLILSHDIYIEDNVWIGAGAIIMPGVRIGRCSIIGANSFLNKNVEPFSIYAGTPAKKIKNLK